MKTILLHISGDKGQETRMEAALSVARAVSGHLTCCQPVSNTVVMAGYVPGTAWTTTSFDQLETQAEEKRQAVRKAIEADLSNEDVPWDWVKVIGLPSEALIDQSYLADLTVCSLSDDDDGYESNSAFLSSIITSSAGPVLAVPDGHMNFQPTGKVLIAWDGSREAAQAVRAALPLLKLAEDVLVVTVGDLGPRRVSGEDLARYLSRAGLKVETEDLVQVGDVSDQLLEHAKLWGAAYIVMGGYGHSRLTELILGGETRRMLAQRHVPVLLAH